MRRFTTISRAVGALVALLLALPSLAFAVTPTDPGAPLTFVPKETPFVVVVPSVGDVVARIGLPKLFDKHKVLFDAFRAESMKNAGVDLLTVSGWNQAGIDLMKPGAFAFIDPEREGFVLFMAVADHTRLEASFRRLMGDDLTIRKVEGASVFVPRTGSGRFVVRGDWAALVVIDRGDDRAVHVDKLADQVAALSPDASIATHPRFTDALGTLAGSDVVVWLDVKRTAELILAEEKRWREQYERNGWAEKQLVEAKERADSPDRIADLERQVKDEAERDKARAARDERMDAFVTRLTSTVGGIALGARVDGAAIALRGQILLDDGHILRSLLKAGSPMSLSRALSTSPIGLVEASIDGAVLASLLKEFLGAVDVMDFDEVRKMVKQRYELDLDQDVLAKIGGAFGMAFSMKGDSLQAAFTALVTDDSAAKGVLDRMAASERTQEFLRASHQGSTAAWTIPWAHDGEARLRLASGRLSLSNDPALADRIADAKAGTWLASNPATKWLAGDGVVLIGAMDMGQIVLALAKEYGSYARVEYAIEMNPSAETKKLQKALATVDADLAKLEKKDMASRQALVAQVARLLGPTSLAVSMSAPGLTLAGGHVVGGKTIEASIDGIMAAIVKREGDDKRHRDSRDKLEKKRQGIYDALEKAGRTE